MVVGERSKCIENKSLNFTCAGDLDQGWGERVWHGGECRPGDWELGTEDVEEEGMLRNE